MMLMMSWSIFSSRNRLHEDENTGNTHATLPKVFVTLLFAMHHNFSELAQHLSEFAVRSDSGNVVKSDDFLVQFSVE